MDNTASHEGIGHDPAYQEMMKIFEESSFWRRMGRMFSGIGKPKDSGEYKFAKLQLQRLSAPFLAVVIPIAVLCVLLAVQVRMEPPQVYGSVDVGLVSDQPIWDPEPTPPDANPFGGESAGGISYTRCEFGPDSDSGVATTVVTHPLPNPVPTKPVMWRGSLFGSGPMSVRRNTPKGREIDRLKDDPGEIAVMNALRWFVTRQNADGSWGEGGNRTAMTGMALLCFLAHGEKPGGEEFGEAVKRGLMFLVDGIRPDGTFAVRDGNNYSHAIATYALCEAYSMTQMPILREAAELTLVPIIKGQHRNGGWDYNLAQTDRDDTSFMGWCAQAVKAGHVAGLDVPGLEKAFGMVAPGMKQNFGMADKNRGGFGYTSPDPNHGLTAVGVLCMQLTGSARAPEVRAGLNTIDTWRVGWEDSSFGAKSGSGQYYFYYATQCMYHDGGTRWTKWNDRMKPAYAKAQTVTPASESGYVNEKGVAKETGFWLFEAPPHVESGGIFDTALITLQLEMGYRFLPTAQPLGVIDGKVLGVVDEGEVVPVIRF